MQIWTWPVISKLQAPVSRICKSVQRLWLIVLILSLYAVANWLMLAFTNVQETVNFQGSGFGWLPICLLVVGVITIFVVVALGPAAGFSPSLVVFATVSFVSAIEAVFAVEYLVMSIRSPDAFNEHLSRASAAYFAIATATTTGFGDIHPCTDSARLLVTAQMVASFLAVVAGLGTAFQRFLAPKPSRSGDPPGEN